MLRVGLSLHILTFSPDILMLRGDGASHSAFFLWGIKYPARKTYYQIQRGWNLWNWRHSNKHLLEEASILCDEYCFSLTCSFFFRDKSSKAAHEDS